MNQQNSTFGDMASLRTGSMLLYRSDFKYFGNLLLEARSAKIKADVIINVVKRMRFLWDSHTYFQGVEPDTFFSDATQSILLSSREMKKLSAFIQDVNASPIKRQDCYEILLNHINNYSGKNPHYNSYLPRYVCDDFDAFCNENKYITHSQKRDAIVKYKEEFTRTDFGNNTKLTAAIQRFFWLNFTKKNNQQKLKSLLDTMKSSFESFFTDSDVLKIKKLLDTSPIQSIYTIYEPGSISDENHGKLVDLFLSPEVDELMNIVQKIQKTYRNEADIAKIKIDSWINKDAFSFRKVRNIEDIVLDTSMDVFLLMTQNMWNGSYTYKTVDEFASGAGKKMISTRVKDPNNKSIELTGGEGEEDSQEGEDKVDEKMLNKPTIDVLTIENIPNKPKHTPEKEDTSYDNENEEEDETEESIDPVDTDDTGITRFAFPDNREEFDTYYAKILKPYQEKYKEPRSRLNNIHVAMLYLEHCGNYRTLTIDAYGEFNKREHDRARHAKESGRDRIIRETPTMYYEEFKQKIKTEDLFTAVELYSSKLNNSDNLNN